jgi:hypothetical protein
VPSSLKLTDFTTYWGQFIAHGIYMFPYDILISFLLQFDVDFAHTPVSPNSDEWINIQVPKCDAHFDPNCKGNVVIPMRRSIYKDGTGTNQDNPR